MAVWTYSPYFNGHKRPIPTSFNHEEDDLQDLAEACAEDDHSNYDGFERGNQRAINLFLDGTLHSSYTVTVDYEPVFSAQRAQAQKEQSNGK
nr:hypothetical protein [Comamonas thiooxydans]